MHQRASPWGHRTPPPPTPTTPLLLPSINYTAPIINPIHFIATSSIFTLHRSHISPISSLVYINNLIITTGANWELQNLTIIKGLMPPILWIIHMTELVFEKIIRSSKIYNYTTQFINIFLYESIICRYLTSSATYYKHFYWYWSYYKLH